MPIEVTMPKLSPTMETGVIAQWLVKVGDQIKEGDVLAEIETDKATMPMKSYDDGTVVQIDHAAGDEVALGQRVLVLAKKGEDPQQVAASLGGGSAAQSKPTAPAAGGKAASAPKKAEADDRGPEPDRSRGNGQQKPDAGNGRKAVDEEPQDGSDTRRLKVSPLARKLAESSGIELSRVRGSGPGGRIVRRDIEEILERSPGSGSPATAVEEPDEVDAAEPEPTPAASPKTAPVPPTRPSPAPLAAQRIPHTRMRKTIAQRMLQAKQAAPEIHLTVDIRADRLVAVREELNKRLARDGIKLSLGDFVTKAVALALRAHPGVNANFEADAIVRHAEVNIGIAVALPDGLIVPVLHHADTLGLREIRRQSEALATAARASTLTGEQLTGGTFTISNLGMYGIRQFDAIINLPEVGILAVGAADSARSSRGTAWSSAA